MFDEARTIVGVEAGPAFARVVSRGFVLVDSTGRYPRVEARRAGPVALSIDFWMTLDEDGQYRPEWTREVFFELGGSAAVDRQEGADWYRYWRPFTLYESRAYDLALKSLAVDVEAVADMLETWTEDIVIRSGSRTKIARPSVP